MNPVFRVIFNSIIVFILLIALTRIIGRKLLSQMTFFDFVIGVTIGAAGGAFITEEVRGYYVLLSPVILTIAVFCAGLLSLSYVPFRKLMEGEPVVVIQNGKIFEKNLGKLRSNVDDLMSQLRQQQVFDLNEVEFAILEPHGRLSVLKKSQYQSVRPIDIGVSTPYQGVSSEIIRDGRIVEANLRQNNLTHEWLMGELAKKNVNDVRDVFYATLATNGSFYVDLRRDNPGYIQETEDDDSVI